MGNKPIVHAPIATGSTEPRDIRDRFADWCNVKDFGAKGDGLTDDSSAFLAAQASGAPAIMVPEGSYYITEDIPGIFYSFGEVEKTGIGNVTIINLLANGSVPVGTVLWLSTSTVPAGFLLCNGQAVARATYPDLFNTIGTTYGAGDGSTTFNLPNLIDKFIEGSTTPGTVKAAGLPNITGSFTVEVNGLGSALVGPTGAFALSGDRNSWVASGSSNPKDKFRSADLDASRSSVIYGGSSTVQPPALTLLPCIKAYSDVDNLGSLDVAQLENYVQNSVVHKTGNEEITGQKHFSFGFTLFDHEVCIQGPASGWPRFTILSTDIDCSAPPSTYTGAGGFHITDKNSVKICEWSASLNSTVTEVFTYAFLGNGSQQCVALRYNTDGTSYFIPGKNNAIGLGGGGHRWTQLYASTASISTSDERLKTSINSIPDEVLDAWGTVGFVQFKFNDSVKEKGSNARLHSGLVAQRIDEAFKAAGLDASSYGLFCHDSWKAEPERLDDNGTVMQEAIPAGEEYSLRYEEALCMEAAYQRRRADRAEARIASLEERLAALEVKLDNSN